MNRSRIYSAAGVLAIWAATGALEPRLAAAQAPKRGDANSDTRVDIGDPIFILNYIFSGGPAPKCAPAANANGDSRLDISDAIALLSYLFSGQFTIQPLTAAEIAQCPEPPPPLTVVRHGTMLDVIEPSHGIQGSRVEQWSDGTIRLKNFYYDGQGVPLVVVLLSKGKFDHFGFVVSGDLTRNQPYVNETFSFPIPPEATNDKFGFVSIWCDDFPLHYAIATLFPGGFP
jgi:hypothetical protein